MELDDKELLSDQGNAFDLRGWFAKIAWHWPLFLFSLLACSFAGYIYLRYTVPVFEIKTALVIKDEQRDASTNLLRELSLNNPAPALETEMELIKSKSLVGEVVYGLELYIQYIQEGRVRKSDIYDESPFRFKIIKGEHSLFGKELEVRRLKNGKLRVKFDGDRQTETAYESVGTFKDSRWKLIPNEKYTGPSDWTETVIKVTDPNIVIADYQSRLQVGFTNRNKAVIGLTIHEENPRKGVDFLNKLIEVYNLASVADKNRVAKNSMAFLDERLDYISKELSMIEKELEDFKSSRKLTDISSESSMYLSRAIDKDAQIAQSRFKLQLLDDISRFVAESSINEPMPATFGIDDAVLQAQLSSFNVMLAERERMLATSGPQSPLLVIKEQQITTARNTINENLLSLRKVMEASLRELQNQSADIEGSIRLMPVIEREFISIKRQQSIKEQLYLFLLQKREEAGITYASAVSDSRIVDPAYYSPVPVTPRKGLVIQIVLAMAVLLPFVFIYLKELLNNKIVSPADLRKLSDVPYLGEIAFNETNRKIVIGEKSRSVIAEHFRSVRTNLGYIAAVKREGDCKVIMITSSVSGEGKTFCAINLALSVALTGKRTLILDLDLRKPRLARYLGIDNDTGVSSYLSGAVASDQIIRTTDLHEGLSVVTSGPVPPNPSELLVNERAEHLIQTFRTRFDFIIIDTPPVGVVADANIVSRFADASIFVVRHGYTMKSQVENINKLYRENKLPGMCIVLNGVSMKGRYGYGYGYGYHKDDGYYHDDHQKKPGLLKTVSETLKRI